MGTNYYATLDPCACCGRGDETLHIGKSSAGWPFTLHIIPERNLVDWNSWKAFLDGKQIKDEYGDVVLLHDLDQWIVAKRRCRDEPHCVEARRDHPNFYRLSADGDHLSPGDFS